ncbi:MAG: XisI protein [Chloracidobacterium sp.]|nr:XisI protein [Chloracidobacterium sp.]
MDQLNHYRQDRRKVIAGTGATASGQSQSFFDRQADNHALVAIGWRDSRHIHHFVVHIENINEVRIQADNTDLDIAVELERGGVPKHDIVLVFHPPHVRLSPNTPLLNCAFAIQTTALEIHNGAEHRGVGADFVCRIAAARHTALLPTIFPRQCFPSHFSKDVSASPLPVRGRTGLAARRRAAGA